MVDTLKENTALQAVQNNPDVKLAFDIIKAKKPGYTQLINYYKGNHPLRYSTEKLHKVFENFDVYFAQNWLSVVVDAVIDRMILNGFDISDNEQAKVILDDMWRDFNISLIAEDVHESLGVVNEAFVIAMQVEDEDGNDALDIYFNDARMCHMFYSAQQPDKKRAGAKLYQDDEGFTRLTLYYADRFEHYRSRTPLKSGVLVTSSKLLELDPDLPVEENPFEQIPVFHWVASKTIRKKDLGPSELSIQDAINKLMTDMMVSSEFNSFVQRVIISKADPGNLSNESGVNWWIPAADDGQASSVIELGGRDLSGYLSAIDKLATSLAIITRTPKHYFFAQGGDPSGEALIALEAPLNKKVKKRQSRYKVEWQNFAQFLLSIVNVEIKKNQIVPIYEPAETIQPQTSANIVKTQKESGMPLITALRRQGWSQNEIKQLKEDKQQEDKEMSGLAQDALAKLRAEDAKNNTPPDGRINTQSDL